MDYCHDWQSMCEQILGPYFSVTFPNFVTDKFQEDKCLESFFGGINAVRTNARRHFLVGQMPGVIFWSDICQEDKCLEAIFDRTNARRTNAWSQFLIGQMPGGQMPEPTFGPDKCLNPHWSWEGGRTNASTDKCLEDKCLDGQMPVLAFVLQGICLSRHLSANRHKIFQWIFSSPCE